MLSTLVAMRYYWKFRNLRGLENLVANGKRNMMNKSPQSKFRYLQLNQNIERLKTEKVYTNKAIDYYQKRQSLL